VNNDRRPAGCAPCLKSGSHAQRGTALESEAPGGIFYAPMIASDEAIYL
jgi:hypothetical protein